MADSTDSTSPSTSLLDSILNTGLGIAKQQLAPDPKPAAVTPAAKTSSLPTWLLPVAGVVVVVVILFAFLRK